MSVTDDMRAILAADATFMALLPGGLYGEPLDPASPVTGAAFVITPPSTVKRLRPCAVLLEPQEVDDPRGRNPERRLDAELWLELVLYAERGAMAATFDPADVRAMALLHGQQLGLADVTATGYRARPLEADELPGNVWTTLRRYRARLVRHIAGV
jgi:hypothetical protein